MNAGTSNQFFSQVIQSGLVWDPVAQSIHPFTLDNFHFGYRTSILQKNSQVLLEVSLALLQGDIQAEQAFIRKKNATRSLTQPLQFPNAGCTWKNPEKVTVGKIIEEAGLKGKTIGKAMVSTLHANFIVNLGGATFQDILALMELVEKTIYERYNIHLERELQIIA
jgi:UDP-N-acetylmuramate dehydrogenase